MKRVIYINCFIVLGLLLQQLIHAGVEMLYIRLLTENFDRYGLGLSWNAWFIIHAVLTAVLFFAGAIWGYRMGKKCWVWIYVENKRGRVVL